MTTVAHLPADSMPVAGGPGCGCVLPRVAVLGAPCLCHLRWDEGTCPAAAACWAAALACQWELVCARCSRHNYCVGPEHVADGPGCYGPSLDAGGAL